MAELITQEVAGILEAQALRGGRIAVGLSGGVDSVVLLDVLHRLRPDFDLNLAAVHVNHQISAHAGEWEAFCETLCGERRIPFTVRRVCVDPAEEGVEAAARRLRYGVYASLEADVVALAHQRDDQVETFLLQLLRGAGPRGLAAMPVLKEQLTTDNPRGAQAARILRPLLQVTRSEVEAYAAQRGLGWVEDESNADVRFERNFLRREILPRIEQRFPAYRETLGRAVRNIADYLLLAEELAAIDAQSMEDGGVPVERLRQLSDVRALNLLRSLFGARGLPMPPRVRVVEALRQCRNAAVDAEVHVEFGEFGLRLFRGRVELVEHLAQIPDDWRAPWDGRTDLRLPEGLGCLRSRPAIGEGIARRHFETAMATVRGRRGGERIRPAGNRPSRALKNLLQENSVPPWERGRMPLVFFGDRLAWVPGIGVAAEYRARAGEPGVVPEWDSNSAARIA